MLKLVCEESREGENLYCYSQLEWGEIIAEKSAESHSSRQTAKVPN